MNRKYRKGEENLIGTFGVSGLSAYLLGVIQGYVRGFMGEHRAVKRVLFPITALILVFFIIHLSTSIFPLLKKETEPAVSIAQAAEKEKITSPASEGGAAGKEEKLEEKKTEIGIDKTLDLTAPVIKELHIGDFEVSKVDQPVPVTVSVSAEDDTTPVRQLTYAFLPEGEEIQEDDWMEESTFTMEITKNGVWIVYCKDDAGNIATAERELVVVDSKAPTISISLQNKETWCRENTIYVSAEDSLPVEYRYICTKLGEDSGWLVESSKDVGANGIWAIQVRDAAGNIAEQEIEVSNIDTQAPIIRSITEKTEGETVKNEE